MIYGPAERHEKLQPRRAAKWLCRGKEEVMNNFLLTFFLTAFLIWGSSGPVFAAGPAGTLGKTYRLSALTRAEVKNLQGEKLGEIEDFVLDGHSGKIGLVIFSHGGISGLGRRVKLVPYSLFVFNEGEKNFLLDANREDLIPSIGAKNLQGDDLGKIEDLVMDSRGRVLFAILAHKETTILIPLAALSLDRSGSFFVLDASDEMLDSAPSYEGSADESRAEEIYRHFGQAPYWKEGEEKPGTRLEDLVPLPKF
jgi:sporulation protein YlmC with PRC-barrel domain